MIIRKANSSDIKKSLDIAKTLKQWFTKEAIKNMKIDFVINNTIIVINKKEVIGFLCYNSDNGIIKLIWIGVEKEHQRKGIGKLMLDYLEKEARKIKSNYIEVETLTEKDNYKPYRLTRDFYKKYGFKKLYLKKAPKPRWDDVDVMGKKVK
ncbi:MAG: GNAT family N-acetyltransferase [Nanoarchaeota archaeon]|nr:GNAT family N-acetyltransferase [Nanoarchaeota archaeon]